jgi:hypothetical protein
LIVIPVLCAIIIFVSIYRDCNISRRDVLFYTMAICGVYVVVLTEALSLVNFISTTGMALGWLLLGAAVWYYGSRNKILATDSGAGVPRYFSLAEHVLLVFSGLIIVVVAAKAFIVPICDFDGMIYHYCRISHWIQNGNVNFFATSCLKELHPPPWAEYAGLQLQLLWGNDRLANFVQFASMLGSLLVVSLIARQLGANRWGQVVAVIFCATIPMGIMQASSSLNDYAASLWLAAFVYSVLRYSSEPAMVNLGLAGCTLGLAVFTKGPSYLYAFPFFVWLIVSIAKQGNVIKRLALVCGIVLAINAGHYLRNTLLLHNPLGPLQESASSAEKYGNELHSWRVLVSNTIRNAALHSNTISTRVNTARDKVVVAVHHFIGLSPDDPRTSAWMYGSRFTIFRSMNSVNSDGNTIHFLIIVLCAAGLLFGVHKRYKSLSLVVVGALCGFLLFCWFIKWQPYHSRLHLPLFVLLSAVVGFTFARFRAWVGIALCILLIVQSLPYVFKEHQKPFWGNGSILQQKHQDMYFTYGRYYQQSFSEAAAWIKREQLKNVGMVVEHEAWEYPIFALLGKDYRLQHLNVENGTELTANGARAELFQPGVIIRIKARYVPDSSEPPVYKGITTMFNNGRSYKLGFSTKYIDVFEKEVI